MKIPPFFPKIPKEMQKPAVMSLPLAAVILCTRCGAAEWTLGARVFGLLLGGLCGLAAACVCGCVSAVVKRSLRKISGGRETTVEITKTCVSVWVLLGMLLAYLLGTFFDWEYFTATQADLAGSGKSTGVTLSLVSVSSAAAVFMALGTRLYAILRMRGGKITRTLRILNFAVKNSTLLLMLLAIYIGMTALARPNIPPRPIDLPEGIYIYANDTVYNLPPLNLYSSRMRGFTHTGICLVTRTPGEVNARRSDRGWRLLRFEKLDRGYYMNDVNLDIRDRDGLANHASRTSLSDISFPFDLAGFNHYLAGRSTNDRPSPAVMLARVDVPDAEAAWQDVIRFRDEFNEKYPDGFIYSPVPYRAKYVALYNCNTVIATIAGQILGQGEKYDFITDIPLCFGGQTAADGKRMLDDMMTHDRRPDIARQYEFMKTAPMPDQPLMHRLLHKNGWLHGLTGNLREE